MKDPTNDFQRLGEEARRYTLSVATNIAKMGEQLRRQYIKDIRVGSGVAHQIEIMTAQAGRIAKSVNLEQLFGNVRRILDRLPDGTKFTLVTLGRNGWYLDPEMPVSLPMETSTMILEQRVEEAESVLIEHYSSRSTDILNFLSRHYPKRSKILKSAFQAHDREEYALSVPVLLAQADGICREKTGVRLYSRKGGKPRFAVYLERVALSAIQKAFLYPLSEPLPISAPQDDPDLYPSELNRHEVLHGESTDYASLVNSCKAISLIYYVGSCLREINEEAPEN